MDVFSHDLRLAVRGMRRQPLFTLVVVVTLALGIGANATIFSLLDRVLLRSLPVKHPEALVMLDGPGPFIGMTFGDMRFSHPMYKDFRDGNQVFAGVIGRFGAPVTMSYDGTAERVTGELVTGNFFDVLGVRPVVGRTFTQADDTAPGAHTVAILNHGFWLRRFGGDPTILNRTIGINGHPFTVVGVLQPGFATIEVGENPDVYLPVAMKAQATPSWNELDNRRARWLHVMARLAPGVTLEQAVAAMNVRYSQILQQEIKEMPDPPASFRERFLKKQLTIVPAGSGRQGRLRTEAGAPLVVLMAMTGLVLLIACANVANLFLARAAAQQKEVTVRLALGAGRGRLLRQRLVESLVYATAGGALGLVVAYWCGAAFTAYLPNDGNRPAISATPDARVLLFTLGLSALTAMLFGLGPAVHTARVAIAQVIRNEAGTTTGGLHRSRFRRGLVVAQVALSVLLLVGAGLFARSLYNLRTLQPGFTVDRLLTFSLDPSLSGYDPERATRFLDDVRERVGAIPGVRSVSLAAVPLMTDSNWQSTVRVDGYTSKDQEDMNPSMNGVGPAFFSTMGIPLLRGREFTDRDTADAPKVAIVNEEFARYFYGDGNPIGRRFGFGRNDAASIEIVGVVKDTRSINLRQERTRFVYVPAPQVQNVTFGEMTFYVRLAGEGADVSSAVRGAVRTLDANMPVYNVRSMETQVDESLVLERVVAALSTSFGVLATVLAAIGLYGVMSYAVARRTREIGIRMALGADRGTVATLIMREVALLAIAGVVIGLPLAMTLTRYLRAQLFGLSPLDPLTLAGTVTLLSGVALVSGYLPARRATSVSPTTALRDE